MSKRKSYSIVKSFSFALFGILRSLRYERNLRIHFLAAAYILYFSRYYELSGAEYAVLISAIGAVIVCELINTAIEACVDLNTLVYSGLAKIAKDAAAGAVFISAAASVAVGFSLFWRPKIFSIIWSDIAANPVIWLLSLVITAYLIAWPEYRAAAGSKDLPE